MVKLAGARSSRLYGPEAYADSFELANAIIYFIATVLLLIGAALQFPDYNNIIGLVLVLFAVFLVLAVNLHDLHAHLAGIHYQMHRIRLDKQLAYVEVAAPLVYAGGSIFLFVGVLFLLRTSHGRHYSQSYGLQVHAVRLLLIGSALWLLGSVLNMFEVYERSPLEIQAYQNSVKVPMIVGSTLLVLCVVLGLETWPKTTGERTQATAACLATIAMALYVVASIMNLIRVLQLRELKRIGNLASLEPLRGGAEGAGSSMRAPLLGEARPRVPTPVEIDVNAPPPPPLYKEAVLVEP